MAGKTNDTTFLRSATTNEGQVTINVDAQSVTFTVRDTAGHISQVRSSNNSLSNIVDGEPIMFTPEMEKKFAGSVKALGQSLRAKGNLSPDDYTHAAMVALNVGSVNDTPIVR